MNEFNVLLNAATNGTPSGSLFDALFARYIAPQESWCELESPLPITILAAGEDLIDYRIYGADGGVGVATESGEPAGYKLPMVVRSENLFNMDESKQGEGYVPNSALTFNNGTLSTANFFVSEYVKVVGNKEYVLVSNTFRASIAKLAFYKKYNGEYVYISDIAEKTTTIFTTPEEAEFIRFSVDKSSTLVMLTEGSTAPTEYIPYYRDEENIYIGSDPLAEDEYVDFGEQKVYRMEGGTLTPTDPPTPIPALPTIEGETIIDYNPSETPAVEPEKMYIKYKPQ